MLASILKISRDEYYDLFTPENIKISVVIDEDTKLRKITQSINYLHDKYFNLLIGKAGKVQHSQCKFELLTAKKRLKYRIFIGIIKDQPEYIELEEKLKKRNFGYGIYLGQRQFLADIDNVVIYDSDSIKHYDLIDKIDSACVDDSVKDLDIVASIGIIQKEKVPADFKKIQNGREIQNVKNIIFEQSGKRLSGQFNDIYEVDNQYLYFY
jgi:CRISPR-associated protein Cas5 subtype I-B